MLQFKENPYNSIYQTHCTSCKLKMLCKNLGLSTSTE